MKIISKENINREVEQDRRYLTYQRDRESLEVCKVESDETFTEKYRVDNLLTNGVYFVEQDGKKLNCTCPDYLNRCSELNIRCKHILAVENWKARKEQAKTMKNFQDYLEKSETSATGRALAALGYGTLQSVELDEGKIVDSPVKIGGNKGNNGSNGSNGKIEIQVFKPEGNKGNGKIGGSNGTAKQAGEEEGRPKASLQQVRYIKDLCKNLKIEPKMYVPGLSRAQASKMIEDLQGELERRKKAKE